jgi:hypothetical protein
VAFTAGIRKICNNFTHVYCLSGKTCCRLTKSMAKLRISWRIIPL